MNLQKTMKNTISISTITESTKVLLQSLQNCMKKHTYLHYCDTLQLRFAKHAANNVFSLPVVLRHKLSLYG